MHEIRGKHKTALQTSTHLNRQFESKTAENQSQSTSKANLCAASKAVSAEYQGSYAMPRAHLVQSVYRAGTAGVTRFNTRGNGNGKNEKRLILKSRMSRFFRVIVRGLI